MRTCLMSLVALGVLSSAPARADAVLDSLMPEHVPFVVGGGVGFVPDYLGADETWVGVAPMVRYQQTGTQRFAMLFINEFNVNVLDDANWAAGPVANLNLGRQNIKDDVVKRMEEVDPRFEYGAFVRYQQVDPSNARNRWAVNLTGMARDESKRYRLGVQAFRQVSMAVDVAVGGGVWYGNEAANNAAVGIGPANRGTSGLADFSSDAGFNQIFANVGAVVYLSKQWAVIGGLKYAHIPTGGHKPGSSPMVKERGTNDLLAGGLGVTYLMW
jgi:MipA family protein